MNLILIDLKEHNHNKLKEMSENFNWNTDALLLFKDNNISKIWVDVDTKDVVAYQSNKDPNLYLGDDFSEKLLSMKSFRLPKKSNNLVFNLDVILEKISSKGINSLTTDEKNYLDSLNK
jgi:hypothetical protein